MTSVTLAAAIENNQFAYLSALGRWDGVRVFDEPEILYLRSQVPFPLFNAHMRLSTTTEGAKAQIAKAVRYAKERRVPVAWYTGPQTRPLQSETLLQEAGFARLDVAPGMATAMADLPPVQAHKFSICQVESDEQLKNWQNIFSVGFKIPTLISNALIAAYKAVGFLGSSPLHHFIANAEGKAVGCASVFMGAGAAGIYNIATLPEFRGRGVGSALTLTCLHYGYGKGFRVGVLQASSEGLPLYRGLGFVESCTIGIYVYTPK